MSSSSVARFGLFLLGMLATVACASGDDTRLNIDPATAGAAGTAGVAGATGGSNGAGTAGTGTSGAGAGGTSAAGAGAGGATAAGASGGGAAGQSGGAAGQAVTCDPVAQTGCPTEQPKCSLLGKAFVCDTAGDVAAGQPCAADQVGDNCAAGSACVQDTCTKFCTDNASCGLDATCSLVLDGPNGATFKVCQKKSYDCDPAKQTGCKAGEGCYPQNSGYKCDTPGELAVGAECQFAADCVAGSSCLKLDGKQTCFKLCSSKDGSGCDAAETCSKVDDNYGICKAK